MSFDLHHFIDGVALAGNSGRFSPVFEPSTGTVRARLPLADEAEVDRAVRATAGAFPAWAATPPLTRARILFRFKQLLEQHADALAALISAEHGKVASDARGSLQRGIEVVEFACGIPHLLKGSFPPTSARTWTVSRCASRSASASASPRSTSRRWCRCRCSRWRSPAATPSCSSPRKRCRRAH